MSAGYLNKLATAFLIGSVLILFGRSEVWADNQAWVVGFFNINNTALQFEKRNGFYRHALSPMPHRSIHIYLERYLGKQGMGLSLSSFHSDEAHMDISGDSPFAGSDYGEGKRPFASFQIYNIMFTLPRVWLDAEGYFKLGTTIGGGVSQCSTHIKATSNDYWTLYGPALMAGAFMDLGGDGFGVRFGVLGVSSWRQSLDYKGHKLNMSLAYTSGYIDFRAAW